MIVINADDFGYSPSVNSAILKCFDLKYIVRASIMVNMPFYRDAVCLAKQYNLMDKVGLHLNLTEGYPITNRIKNNHKFCGKDGQFNQCFRRGVSMFILNEYDKKCVMEEIQAQIDLYRNSGFTLMHIDSHHHIHTLYSIYTILKEVAKKNNFKSIRISRNIYNNDCSIVKKIYKNILNYKFKKEFNTTDYFGSYSDFDVNRDKKNIEIMVHPNIINGQVVDVLNKKDNIVKNISSYYY